WPAVNKKKLEEIAGKLKYGLEKKQESACGFVGDDYEDEHLRDVYGVKQKWQLKEGEKEDYDPESLTKDLTAYERQALDGIYYEKFGRTYSAEVHPYGSWKDKNIVEITTAEGNKWKFGYDDKGKINSLTDETGETFTTEDGKTWKSKDHEWHGTVTVDKD